MEMGSALYGKFVVLSFAGEKPKSPDDCPFKGQATKVIQYESKFSEMIQVSNGNSSMLLGRHHDDRYWTAIIDDPKTDSLCRTSLFEIDILN